MFNIISDIIFLSIVNYFFLFSVLGFYYLFKKIVFSYELDELLFPPFILGLLFLYICVGILFHFISISNTITWFVISFGLILFIFINKKNLLLLTFHSKYIKILIISILFGLYGLNNNDIDYHYYHILQNKINNLTYGLGGNSSQYRVAYNSIWLFLQSVFFIENFFYSLYFLNSVIFAVFVRDFYVLIKKTFVNRQIICLLFCFCTLMFVLASIHKYKDFGTDYAAHLVLLYIVALYFLFFQRNINYNFFILTSFLFLFAVICKVFSVVFIIFFLFLIYKIKVSHLLKKLRFKHLVFLFLPLMIWFSHNIAISGCVVYPINITCFPDLPWSIQSTGFGSPKHDYQLISLFAKSFKVYYWDYSFEELRHFNNISIWFPYWSSDHLLKIIEHFLPIFILLIIIPVIYIIKNKIFFSKNSLSNIISLNDQLFLSIIVFFLISIWFIKAPAIRFGFAYLVLFLLLFLIPLWYKTFYNKFDKLYLIINNILIISLIIFACYNLFRIYNFIIQNNQWGNMVNLCGHCILIK